MKKAAAPSLATEPWLWKRSKSSAPSKQAQLPQPLLVGEMLQSPPHPHSPALGSLQYLLIFLQLGSPALDTGLQMGPHQGRVDGEENLPRPAGHTPLDAPQDPIGLLGIMVKIIQKLELYTVF